MVVWVVSYACAVLDAQVYLIAVARQLFHFEMVFKVISWSFMADWPFDRWVACWMIDWQVGWLSVWLDVELEVGVAWGAVARRERPPCGPSHCGCEGACCVVTVRLARLVTDKLTKSHCHTLYHWM